MNLLLTKQPNMPEAEVIDKLSEDVDKPKGEFLSLERILKDTSDSYQTWRYLFQSIAETKQHRVLRFHWCHLHCFCTAMDRLLRNTEKMLINAKA